MTTLQEKINQVLSHTFYFGATSLKVVSEENSNYEAITLEGGVTICLPDLDGLMEYSYEFEEEYIPYISIQGKNGEYKQIRCSSDNEVYELWKGVKALLQK